MNESLQTLDTFVAGTVEEPPRNDPPGSPAMGDCYILGAAPTGVWSGNPLSVAAYTSAGWRLMSPQEGMVFHVRSNNATASYRGGGWEIGMLRGSSLLIDGQQVVGSQAAAIASASGGMTVDSEARAAIDQILGAMRQHGLIAR